MIPTMLKRRGGESIMVKREGRIGVVGGASTIG
jgi:hypothetical protein